MLYTSKELEVLRAENAALKAQALERTRVHEQEKMGLRETVEALKARLEKLERSISGYVLAGKVSIALRPESVP